MNEEKLKEKLKKIEALFAKSGFDGEKYAASEAIKRIKDRLEEYKEKEVIGEYRFSISERWSRQLFIALCRRYSLQPYRYERQRKSTLMLRAPAGFIDDILSPEFMALNGILVTYLNDITEKIIKEEIYSDTSEVKAISEVISL